MVDNSPSWTRESDFGLGISWVLLCLALGLHVTDEALTGFLSVYNPTVIALRERFGFWPMPTFEFRQWLIGLIILFLTMAMLSPFAFRNAAWIRPIFYFIAIVVGIVNAIAHTAATIFGQTVDTVQFLRPAPGFYSSPFLFAAAVYALFQLWKTRPG